MIPAKEKAKELVVKMSKSLPDVIRGFRIDTSKKYALICVDEMIKYGDKRGLNWLRDVKQEIEKL